MPSLVGTTVAANYLKTSPSSQFGTRDLRIVKIAVTAVGINTILALIDGVTADTGSIKGYTLANSLYSRAVRSLQSCAEVYAVFPPSSSATVSAFTAIISDNTANDSEVGSNDAGTTYGDLEAAINGAMNVAAYGTSGVVTAISTGTITGTTLS